MALESINQIHTLIIIIPSTDNELELNLNIMEFLYFIYEGNRYIDINILYQMNDRFNNLYK